MEIDKWLGSPHIHGGLNISAEVTKSTTETKLLMFLARNIFRTISGQTKDVLRKGYPSGKQYLAATVTQKCQKYLNTFARRRDGAGSRDIIEKIAIFLINCIIKANAENKN